MSQETFTCSGHLISLSNYEGSCFRCVNLLLIYLFILFYLFIYFFFFFFCVCPSNSINVLPKEGHNQEAQLCGGTERIQPFFCRNI